MLSRDAMGTSLGEWAPGPRQGNNYTPEASAGPRRGSPQGQSLYSAPRKQSPYAAYSPGAAQPMQQPGQGTPYGRYSEASGPRADARPSMQRESAGRGYDAAPQRGAEGRMGGGYRESAPRGGEGRGGSEGGMSARPVGRFAAGTSQEYMAANPDTGPFRQGGESGAPNGNLAYASPESRPTPFAQNTSFGGQQFGDASQALAQREAFVNNIVNSRSNQAMQWGMGNQQAPSRDFGSLFNQAGQMVQNGWQNPLRNLMG